MTEDKIDETLPYGLAVEKLFLLLDELKKRPSSTDEELGQRVGSSYQRAKSFALELKLITIDDNQPLLTAVGKNIAWEINETEKKKIILTGIVQNYRPYEIVLSRMLREGKEIIPTEFVQQIWARDMHFKLSEENLARAVSFFFQILETAGLCTTFIGRHGQKTRFSFRTDAKDILNNLQYSKENQGSYSPEKVSPPQEALRYSNGDARPEKEIKPKPSPVPVQKFDEPLTEMDPSWVPLTTEFFVLKIQNRPEAWDLLTSMIPLYRNSFSLSKKNEGEVRSQINDTKPDGTPSE
jgi:hypothetical protein